MRKFKLKKSYGEYKKINCSFCERPATQKNTQGADVCYQHIKNQLEEIKCTCGSWLEIRNGKFGLYFNCINCGNLNYQKAMSIKEITMPKLQKETAVSVKTPEQQPMVRRDVEQKSERKEITITSRDLDYFD
ncbi:hypothetical protein COV20_00185 [Candidatus Woesearchaeota archaeon CG10_big_fil_rev_8_21_14_0_10_45_16]|nr:MAG: hypothetical protein COV20_00185 [Candidatus Woesearchaeota archaeon CG10_big_fil_rev_8_21_14_0_10_45_16]